jgi:NADH-quinone oxidoreductase subunit L
VIRFLWLVPLLPFLGAATVGLGGRWLSRRAAAVLACASVGAAFALAVGATLALSGDLAALAGEPGIEIDLTARRAVVHVADWIAVGGEGGVRAPWRLLLDPLSAVMILVVTGVGALIHLYSIGYLAEEERGFARYFAFLNLFVGMMLLLVLGASLPVLFVGWEGVGLCSYLLIGFYYEKDWCADAGRKAFIVNRIGDAGFLLGVVMLFAAAGTLDIDALVARAAGGGVGRETALAASLLLFVGAIGKSAQIPLYVWLPDAMAGPTPVSALIHAATMVTAGVYMVCRLGALYSVHPLALGVVAGIGVATAFYSATIACAQTDIKKVLAYSTVSQLGYMFVGAGAGAFGAAIFHLVTHALFKAALFLGAGSVIHALRGEQEMERMGGLRDRMPVTYFTMVFGALALAGIVPFAGFFSKDEILWAALGGGHRTIWIVALAGAGLTAFYVSRLVLRVFHGEPRDRALAARAHEAPRVMAWPLAVLGGLSVVGGLIGIPRALSMGGDWNRIGRWLAPALAEGARAPGGHAAGASAAVAHGALAEIGAALLGLAVAGLGMYLAWALYEGGLEWARRIPEKLAPLAARARAAYAVDDLYARAVLQPYGSLCAWARRFDAGAVDGMVNGLATTVEIAGHFGRYLQTGFVRNYALFLLLGAALILYWMLP